MKKIVILFATLLLILLPACQRNSQRKRKERGNNKVLVHRGKSSTFKKTGRSLFLEDDDIKEYIFEEEHVGNPLEPNFLGPELTVTLVETDNKVSDNLGDRNLDQIKYGFKRIYFNYDNYSIKKSQESDLQVNLRAVNKVIDEGKNVIVEGHSCHFGGSDVYNLILSEKRAEAVVKWLVGKGVPAEKLKVVGRGNEMTIVPCGDKKAQAPNRRVEFYSEK